ncbi:MAG: ATP-binding protein [Bacteroidetes bacterium]|nr:ATP-binding protein [Bacteroidota bacterium]MBU1373156.1 ATP-binding protein [Bacteroidota bacterium]MBU1484338.1 ATP-binding protein [Bacteroidota bacterium]MBU1761752.1 ATP-binding protein [Bacteroidota bacterium]MBU2047064.1 ATP-binding protein [Bacteroidota bacterium]
MDKKLIKIAIVGPESTGKSTITSALAKHYKTVWVPEYARYYCEGLTGECTMQDELNMFYGQLALEKSMETVAQNNLLFCDTTFLTVKIWSDYQLGETPKPVLDALKVYTYDFYILLKNDIPWEEDPLRDFKDMGGYFMTVWRKELTALNAHYVEVGGANDRLENVISCIDLFLSSNNL